MDQRQPSSATPAPRITAPAPGGSVPPNRQAAVTVTTNAPTLPLELILLSADDPGSELARTNIDRAAAAPSTHLIAIPPDPDPGRPTSYLLALGVRAGFAAEQYRHIIPVTTRPEAG